MSQLALTGALSAGPTGGGDVFPASSFTVPLALSAGAAASFQVASGVLTQLVDSAAVYVPLVGVGPTAAVSQGTFLYLRTNAEVTLRLTVDDGSGGTDTLEMPANGLVLVEFPAARPLELLEIRGTATVEYLVAGNS